jgi:hypothetical protein
MLALGTQKESCPLNELSLLVENQIFREIFNCILFLGLRNKQTPMQLEKPPLFLVMVSGNGDQICTFFRRWIGDQWIRKQKTSREAWLGTEAVQYVQ